MTARHVLADGGWVDLRSKDEVTERLRRPIKARTAKLMSNKAFGQVVARAEADGIQALAEIPDEQAAELAGQLVDSMDALDELNDLLVMARVAAWSYAEVVSVDALLDLPAKTYDEIRNLVAKGALELMPDFGPTQDADSPTVPSTA